MKAHINTILIAIAIVITASIFSNAYLNRGKKQNSINVTGLGSRDFVSDLIVWSGNCTRKNLVLKQAYAELDADRETIKKYLSDKGVPSESIVFSSVSIEKEFSDAYDNSGNRSGSVFTGYRLQQLVQIESKDVDRIEGISREVSQLINQGVEFYSHTPEYYYTKLAALKVEMIAEATKDAKNRAAKIAENAGSGVGRLKTAEMGVFQIVAQNSSEEYSWGGSFNTTAKRKTASITVKLDYEVE